MIGFIANMLTTWSCYMLEAKAICSYERSGTETGFKDDNIEYLTILKHLILESRNKAVREKKDKQDYPERYGEVVPKQIRIPSLYTEQNMFSDT